MYSIFIYSNVNLHYSVSLKIFLLYVNVHDMPDSAQHKG
jgi:hypothetical protein